jgi:chromosome segregation protein
MQTSSPTLHDRRDELIEALEADRRARSPSSASKLEDSSSSERLEVEAELAEARAAWRRWTTAVRDCEQRASGRSRQSPRASGRLDAKRLERQERLVRRRTLEEQLKAESGADQGSSSPSWPPTPTPMPGTGKLERVGNRIERLGNINLAAIDEFNEQSERMRYLDAAARDISARWRPWRRPSARSTARPASASRRPSTGQSRASSSSSRGSSAAATPTWS